MARYSWMPRWACLSPAGLFEVHDQTSHRRYRTLLVWGVLAKVAWPNHGVSIESNRVESGSRIQTHDAHSLASENSRSAAFAGGCAIARKEIEQCIREGSRALLALRGGALGLLQAIATTTAWKAREEAENAALDLGCDWSLVERERLSWKHDFVASLGGRWLWSQAITTTVPPLQAFEPGLMHALALRFKQPHSRIADLQFGCLMPVRESQHLVAWVHKRDALWLLTLCSLPVASSTNKGESIFHAPAKVSECQSAQHHRQSLKRCCSQLMQELCLCLSALRRCHCGLAIMARVFSLWAFCCCMWALHELYNIPNCTKIMSKMIWNNFKDDLALSKKHFPFTHQEDVGKGMIWHFQRNFSHHKEDVGSHVAFEWACIGCSVLTLVPPFKKHSKYDWEEGSKSGTSSRWRAVQAENSAAQRWSWVPACHISMLPCLRLSSPCFLRSGGVVNEWIVLFFFFFLMPERKIHRGTPECTMYSWQCGTSAAPECKKFRVGSGSLKWLRRFLWQKWLGAFHDTAGTGASKVGQRTYMNEVDNGCSLPLVYSQSHIGRHSLPVDETQSLGTWGPSSLTFLVILLSPSVLWQLQLGPWMSACIAVLTPPGSSDKKSVSCELLAHSQQPELMEESMPAYVPDQLKSTSKSQIKHDATGADDGQKEEPIAIPSSTTTVGTFASREWVLTKAASSLERTGELLALAKMQGCMYMGCVALQRKVEKAIIDSTEIWCTGGTKIITYIKNSPVN